MNKIYLLAATTAFATFYAQNFTVAEIPAELRKNANVVIRENASVLNISKVDAMSLNIRTVMTVLNKEGSNYSTPMVSYEKGDRVGNVKVVVYDQNGNKLKTYGKSDFKDYSNNSGGTFHSDNRIMVLPFAATEYPYTVEFSYTYDTENTVFIPDFTPFVSENISLEKSSFTVNNTSGIDLRTKIYPSVHNYANVTASEDGTRKTYTYENVPALKDETFAPEPEKILPKVSFALSSFNLEGHKGGLTTWEDFGSWYYSSLLAPVSTVTPEIKAEVAALNLQGSTAEKVKTLYQFMQNKTRYIFVALGIGGWKPMTADEVQKKGYGDCKALTNYMKTLLDAAGIPSYYSIITMNSSPVSFDADFPKMGGNHVVLVVPTENGNIWLENTSQTIAFNHMGFSTTGRNVLAVKPDGIDILQTPVYSAEESKEILSMNLKLNEDNSITSKASVKLTGSQYDFGMPLVGLDAKQRTNYLKSQWSTLSLESIGLENLVNDKDKAVISFAADLKAVNYAKSVGSDKIFRAVPVFADISLLNDDERMLPVEIRFDTQDEYKFTFQMPEGYTISDIPSDVDLSTEFGNYSLKIKRKDDSNLLVERVLRLKKGVHPKEKYNDYIAFRKKIMSNDNAKILITKK